MRAAMMNHELRERCEIPVLRTMADDALLRRVRDGFNEIPAMRLTFEQAMRLWGLDRSTCTDLLHSLVTAHVLERDGSGRYVLAHGNH